MSWIKTIIVGVVLGSVLGLAAYATLSHFDRQLRLEASYASQESIVRDSSCGLSNQATCVGLASIFVPTKVMGVVTSSTMQPFGDSQEDDTTATKYAQPVDVSKPQVTKNGRLIQGSL